MYEECYICDTMGKVALKARKKNWSLWLSKTLTTDYKNARHHKLPIAYFNQVHIDYINPGDITDVNPDWELGYPGYCRPNTVFPAFWSYHDYFKKLDLDLDAYNREITKQREVYIRFYESTRTNSKDKKDTMIYKDLQTHYMDWLASNRKSSSSNPPPDSPPRKQTKVKFTSDLDDDKKGDKDPDEVEKEKNPGGGPEPDVDMEEREEVVITNTDSNAVQIPSLPLLQYKSLTNYNRTYYITYIHRTSLTCLQTVH